MKRLLTIWLFVCGVFQGQPIYAQGSVARMWNEAVLEAIRHDFARPTIHARNLFHTSIALYDAWAVYDSQAETYLLGKSHGQFQSRFNAPVPQDNVKARQAETASYAIYRVASFRFANSPGGIKSLAHFDSLMHELGYPTDEVGIDYSDGKASSLGNFLATEIIRYGLQDGANEQNDYQNDYYQPVNPPMIVGQPGNPNLMDPDRWQPLAFDLFVDQSGNIIPGSVPDFLSPEWGNVIGFTVDPSTAEVHERANNQYLVYHDPGPPPSLKKEEERADYQWNFQMVAEWSAHMDPNDGVLWDVSPASIGNIQNLPDPSEYKEFYRKDGGDWGMGHSINPKTNQPYAPQVVPRGDYARVLAEFWADGPDSETPPGHWFTLLNYVMDQPEFEPLLNGMPPALDPLEYEVKAYFTLAAAMHDVAITSWAIKGWFDYIRPVSAIRYMAGLGQSSDSGADDYHPQGIPLSEGFIERIETGDALAGPNNENLGKIKLYAWRGPEFIVDPSRDDAGVGWILAEEWWPYQRPTFVTPPFAGYVSGHSTYSRAAADILTSLTGDPFFPGGMAEFVAKKDEFLVFEKGPSVDVHLQWATYRDASDQCSLSRIWGGIHPPADDIPGRKIGEIIAQEVFDKVQRYFNGSIVLSTNFAQENNTLIFPNPAKTNQQIQINSSRLIHKVEIIDLSGRLVMTIPFDRVSSEMTFELSRSGYYYIRVNDQNSKRLVIQ